MRRILVTGTFSTGKSTLCTTVQRVLQSEGFTCAIIPDAARSCSLPLNKLQTVNTTAWLVFRQFSNEIEVARTEPDIMLLDRGLFDIIAHTLTLNITKKQEKEVVEELISLSINWEQQLDKIFVAKSEDDIEVQHDGVRITEKKYQIDIESSLIRFLQESSISYTVLPKKTEDRVRMVLASIKEN